MSKESRHRVAALTIEEVVAFDLTTITQTFGHPDERDHYLLEVCAVAPGPVAIHAGSSILSRRASRRWRLPTLSSSPASSARFTTPPVPH